MPVISGREAVLVALVGQLAVELGDEQAAVGEDQDADRARGLDEPGGSDRLAGSGRVAEAVAADRARVLLRRKLLGDLELLLGVVAVLAVLAVLVLLVVLVLLLDLLEADLGLALRGGDQLGQHPGERVHLVAAQLGAGAKVGRLLGEHALEAEHQRVADLPVVRGLLAAGLDLGVRVVERAAARGAGGEHLRDVLVGVQERLACPLRGALGRGDESTRLLRHGQRLIDGFLHRRSASCAAQFRERRPPETPGGRRLRKHSGSGRSLGRIQARVPTCSRRPCARGGQASTPLRRRCTGADPASPSRRRPAPPGSCDLS